MLTAAETHEINDLDYDILTTREITFTCGHKRVYEDISACQKSWMERRCLCPDCQRKQDIEKPAVETRGPKTLSAPRNR